MLFTQVPKWIGISILFILISTVSRSQSYGLQFSGHNVTLDQRTQLYLTPNKPLPFNSPLELSFKIKMEPNAISYFGYIFRLILGEKNIDLMHGFLPDRPDNFQLVLSDQKEEHSFSIPLEVLTSKWVEFHFIIDIDKQKLICNVLNIHKEISLIDYTDNDGFRLFFGAHTFGHYSTTDVFQMNIRDVEVESANKKTYLWLLDEMEGNIVKERNHHANGKVVNPNWLMKLHNQWKSVARLEVPDFVKTASNPEDGLLYIASSNSMQVLNLSNLFISNEEYAEPYKMLSSNQLVYDTIKKKLICYSLDMDYVHYYNPQTKAWSGFPPDTSRFTTYWHHNKTFDTNGNLYTFGGYGEHIYKNLVFKWDTLSKKFDRINTTGEFYPRYLAGGGFNPNDSLYYLIGGYGTESGLQTVNPEYYYDLIQYSFTDSSFHTLYTWKDTDMGFCFAGSIFIDKATNLYGLKFSKFHFENNLQLVKIPLDNPEIIELGSPIQFHFIDVQSTVDLYYYPHLRKMVAVCTYLNNGITSINIYAIAYPPQKYDGIKEKANIKMSLLTLLLIGGVLILLAALIYLLVQRRKKAAVSVQNSVSEEPSIISTNEKRLYVARKISSNSIVLFGGFQVIDKDGNDITSSFTPLLKKLLLYILLNSLKHNKGVSSKVLYETFWFDKSVESARNNRAVNIVKLKSLLEKVGKSTISKDTGYWKFEMEPGSLYIDYLDYLNITSQEDTLSGTDILNLLSVIDRGPFLRNLDADWLDIYKSEVSNEIIDTLVEYINKSECEPDFILHLTNCMFMFDMVSEEAMILQCSTLVKLGKHSLAKKAYGKFVREYKELYDEDYNKSFNSVIKTTQLGD